MPRKKRKRSDKSTSEDEPPAKKQKLNAFEKMAAEAKRRKAEEKEKAAKKKAKQREKAAKSQSPAPSQRARVTKKQKEDKIAEYNRRDAEWMLNENAGKAVLELMPKSDVLKQEHMKCNMCAQYPSVADRGMEDSVRKCGIARGN